MPLVVLRSQGLKPKSYPDLHPFLHPKEMTSENPKRCILHTQSKSREQAVNPEGQHAAEWGLQMTKMSL